MRAFCKAAARLVAFMVVLPNIVSFRLRAIVMGKDRALVGSTQWLSLWPGLVGQYVRRAFLNQVLEGGCADSAVIEFGTLFSQVGSRIEANVYVGPRCHLGHVHLERDVLVAAGVHIPSGPHTHGTDASETIHDQPGQLRLVRIGAGTWIGSNAVVLADVGRDSVIGAGAVVTHTIPDRVVAAGVPARVVRRRDTPTSVPA
jgi:acetyltransferase-like isoleucine patch superfamily enzyme